MSNPIPIATAADFERKAKERLSAMAEPVTLPSGLVVMAVRPGPDWWMRHLGRLPKGMAARALEQTGSALTPEDVAASSRWMLQLVEDVVISPKIRLNPAPDEVDPYLVDNDDFAFLIRFAGGEISADGTSLGDFPGGSGSAAVGPSSGPVENAPV